VKPIGPIVERIEKNVRSRFAADFRRLVMPVLALEITRLAAELADDRLSFGEAMAELMSLAHRRGAGYLPDQVHDDLREWLSTTLLDEACRAGDVAALVTAITPAVAVAEKRPGDLLNNTIRANAEQSVDAIKNRRFIVIPYVQATPGIDNVLAVETLAKGFHGE